MDLTKYINFMKQEESLANKELFLAKNIDEVMYLYNQIKNKDTQIIDINEFENYIVKNIDVLFDYAPHLTLQMLFTAVSTAPSKAIELPSFLQALIENPNLPAKAYSVVNSYISMFKERETTPPDLSFASDQNILKALDFTSSDSLTNLIMLITVRLSMGEKLDHFIDLMNPFFSNGNNNSLEKLVIIGQLTQISKKYSASKPLNVFIGRQSYYITFDGKFDEVSDMFLRGCSYYLNQLKVNQELSSVVMNAAKMYRYLHLNQENVLNSEKDVKGFVLCIIETNNISLATSNIDKVFNIQIPLEYRESLGFKEANDFLNSFYGLI